MKIYIAGPDVFEPDAIQIGQNYKSICKNYGHEGLFPLDNECDSSKEIYEGNVNLIKISDVVIANGNEFRGEMDVGTAFEVGYAAATGKKIFIYMDDTSALIDKYGKADEQGRLTEDFGHPLNLMLAEAAQIVNGGFEDCVKLINKWNNIKNGGSAE